MSYQINVSIFFIFFLSTERSKSVEMLKTILVIFSTHIWVSLSQFCTEFPDYTVRREDVELHENV